MSTNAIHRDDEGSKIGMWLFLFTELLLFGGLFIVYSVYRFRNPVAFHLAAQELNTAVGAINTIILLVSSMTVAMSISAVQLGDRRRAVILLEVTILLALAFMVNKYFEWDLKIAHGLYPSSSVLTELGNGDVLFFGLYYFMTGLHALHIVVGVIFISVMLSRIQKGTINAGNYAQLENAGLYWHLVDLIWIFLFPLFYLIS